MHLTTNNDGLRGAICAAVAEALSQRPDVLAGWEGGSVALGALDAYSDIDLNFLVTDGASLDVLYSAVEDALQKVSPVSASHVAPPGRYYKLRDGGEFLLLDLCFFRVGAADRHLDAERHGKARPLFDKADWLRLAPTSNAAQASARQQRHAELQEWFLVSQNFVRKALLRRQHADAMAAFWAYTVRPLAELLRMRYCPVRWDFGMRYLDRDLPPGVYARFRDVLFVQDLDDLEVRVTEASTWGVELLNELASSDGQTAG